MTQFHSLYLHVPFCRHRCAYCDFNTYAGQEDSIPAYVEALCRELKFIAFNAPEKLTLHTIFFGGGTPSLLNPQQFETILKTISDNFNLANLETTIEAMKRGAFDYIHKPPSKPIPARSHSTICATCARWESIASALACNRPIPSSCVCWSGHTLISMSSTP